LANKGYQQNDQCKHVSEHRSEGIIPQALRMTEAILDATTRVRNPTYEQLTAGRVALFNTFNVGSSSFRRFFQVSAELKSHGGKKFVLEIRFTARAEPLIKRRGQHRYWNALVNGGFIL
jgi:hypothetical protein